MSLKQIIEGWRNDLFPPEKLKEIIQITHEERMKICKECSAFSEKAEGCALPGTAPCCNSNVELSPGITGCGCPLIKKTKCLSCSCPVNKWEAVISEEDSQKIEQ